MDNFNVSMWQEKHPNLLFLLFDCVSRKKLLKSVIAEISSGQVYVDIAVPFVCFRRCPVDSVYTCARRGLATTAKN